MTRSGPTTSRAKPSCTCASLRRTRSVTIWRASASSTRCVTVWSSSDGDIDMSTKTSAARRPAWSTRSGFERMVADVCLGKVGAVAAREVSRFARNSREWQHLVEMCRVVDTVLIDQDTVYAPRMSNDRLLLGLKGSLNEYELDLLRQRSVEAQTAEGHARRVAHRESGRLRQRRAPLGKGS